MRLPIELCKEIPNIKFDQSEIIEIRNIKFKTLFFALRFKVRTFGKLCNALVNTNYISIFL